MRAAPQEDMRIFLCTQIADEARHVAFFDRFYAEVGVLESDNLQDRLEENVQYINKEFGVLFDEMLHSRVDRLAVEPEDLETLVETVTIYHMVIEGMLALTGQHFIMDYNERVGTLPGFVEGFTKVARDEHRHVAFGARFLRDMARRDPRYIDAIQRTLVEVGPVADGVLKPPWMEGDDDEQTLFGVSVAETRAFAMKALERRMKVIGLVAAACAPPRSATTTSRRSTCGSAGSSRSRTSPRHASQPGSSRSTSAPRSGSSAPRPRSRTTRARSSRAGWWSPS